MQKGLAPLVIIILIALAVGGYLLYQKQTTPAVQQQVSQPSPSPVSSSVASNSAETANWQVIKSSKCGLSVMYPNGWSAREINTSYAPDYPEYNFFCIYISAPDFKTFPGTDARDGMFIGVTRTRKGVLSFPGINNASMVVNNLNGYIKAENHGADVSGDPTETITDVQDKSYGNLNGKYFVKHGQSTKSNFVFEAGNFIYNIDWDKNYNGQYKDQLENILSTFKFLP